MAAIEFTEQSVRKEERERESIHDASELDTQHEHMYLPHVTISAEVACEGLLTPRTLHWVADGSKRGHRLRSQ